MNTEIEKTESKVEKMDLTVDKFEMPAIKRIGYGNLTKKGGFLALLHETSHS